MRRATAPAWCDRHAGQISIHALLAESDGKYRYLTFEDRKFLSTLSLRRATRSCWMPAGPMRHFYPRSPCGERHISPETMQQILDFYPRSPCGERPRRRDRPRLHLQISIHALLAESDRRPNARRCRPRISIHALLAESDFWLVFMLIPPMEFLSTLSLRRATEPDQGRHQTARISIHALLAESDRRM